MNLKLRGLLVALVMSSVVLAGCTDSSGTDSARADGSATDPTKGDISGLLVDDFFRPVQLKEAWPGLPGDFQDTGFILIVETASRLETTENGEFSANGLQPGRYTLRISAENHEAMEKTIDVVANDESSITLEMRRKSNAANPILTIEFSGFVPCATSGAVSFTVGCAFDRSGDSYRPGPIQDYRTPYGTEAHYMIIEAVTSQSGQYLLVLREDDVTGSGGDEYASMENVDTGNPYMKIILENSAVYGRQTAPPTTYTGTADKFYIPEHNPIYNGQNDGTIVCGGQGQDDDYYNPEGTEDSPADYCSWPNSFPGPEESFNPLEALVFFTNDDRTPDLPGHGQDITNPANGNPVAGKDGLETFGQRVAIKINYVVSIFIGPPTPFDDTPENDLNEYCVLCKGYLDEL
jgi:hypothetical protein